MDGNVEDSSLAGTRELRALQSSFNTQPLNRPGPQPWRPKTPINRTLAEQDRHVPVGNEDQGWSAVGWRKRLTWVPQPPHICGHPQIRHSSPGESFAVQHQPAV
eukprot:366279-Chlamydomonas_euryale.AAC.21